MFVPSIDQVKCYIWSPVSIQGSNSEVTYSIVNISGLTTAEGVRVAISEAFFTINSSTADLYVNTNLEREAEVDGYHYYEITVRSRVVDG